MKRILLIDDSAIQLRIMKGILKDRYEVMMATSGLDGIEIVKKKRPDLIILDYEMPVVDGRTTLKMLKDKEDMRDIPVVFLTGVSEKEHIEAVLELKPQGYVLKPAEPEKLIAVIQKILGEQ